jgi:GntR family transcriptional regulator, transcriptional repressor for pyruvate dehydrogenase complex
MDRRKLAERVAADVLAEIRRRELAPGTRILSERELMDALGVGRSTVREALNGLALLGIIEVRHGKGAFVAADPVAHEARDGLSAALAKGVTHDLLEARRPLETETARLAALRRTETDLAEIEATLVAYERALGKGKSGASHAARFHVRLAEAAYNEVLTKFVASIVPSLVERGPLLEALAGYRDWELADHRRIYEAVASGDPKLAAARMVGHLEKVTEYYRRAGGV